MIKSVRPFVAAVFVLLTLCGCSKEPVQPVSTQPSKAGEGFMEYVIPMGGHYSQSTSMESINTLAYNFQVYFDSTAIYNLGDNDQYDINKLTGFADNGMTHTQYSARFGWRWSANRLRLFGFVHNNGVISEKEIGAIEIGKTYTCSIVVTALSYRFSVEGLGSVTLARAARTATAKGYRLFPYFGGNKVAPHDVHVWLKYLP